MIRAVLNNTLIFSLCLGASCSKTSKKELEMPKGPNSSLQRLMEGNKRFVQGISIHPDETSERRATTSVKQEPFAVIIGCSDSRVPPEIVFDQGLGDIFVVRVAGNVVGPMERDSIEFAASELHAPLIMVLGHQKCGAVTAVVQGKADEYDIEAIAPLIEPAVKRAKTMPGDLLTNSIIENVKLVCSELKANSVLSPLIKAGKLKVVGGYYELDKGDVLFLP